MRAPGRGPENSKCGLGKRFWKKRGNRRGHARDAPVAAARPNETNRSGKNRARVDEIGPAPALEELESLAHLAWASPLLRAQA